jgi:hypothetical protein
MRRVLSIILFVIGGWLLMSETLFAWMDLGEGVLVQILALSFFIGFTAAPLGLATLVSPGNRRAELGLTLMITAGISAFVGLTMLLAMNDPAVAKMMPPGETMPNPQLDPAFGAVNLLIIAGAGYLLWRKGRAHLKSKKAELERVFGD